MSRRKLKSPYFYFKQFKVCHERSAMKIGVDSVLLGGWVNLEGTVRLLDVGTGCGILALMAVQRSPSLLAMGIEIEPGAAEEAKMNFESSPWNDRLNLMLTDFKNFVEGEENKSAYDLIISNPPYFDSGIIDFDDPRALARHQGDLSPFSILKDSKVLLKENGRIAMVLPSEFQEKLNKYAIAEGYCPIRLTLVKAHPGAPAKRMLVEYLKTDAKTKNHPAFSEGPGEICEDMILLEDPVGTPTQRHREMLRDFYLKF